MLNHLSVQIPSTVEQFQRYGRDICSKNFKYKFSENVNVNNILKHLFIFF